LTANSSGRRRSPVIQGINTQDFAIQTGMGRIVDRSQEALGSVEGIDWIPSGIHPSEMFWWQLKYTDFDVLEMSLSSLSNHRLHPAARRRAQLHPSRIQHRDHVW
jgi:hypothetical protein